MDKKELLETVNQLAERVNISELDEIEVETDDFRIKLVKHNRPPAPPFPMFPSEGQRACPAPRPEASPEIPRETASGKVVKSPIIGTFYSAPAPGKPPFVSVGSDVKKGAVVCIVESMKLMNEINSDYDGKVAEIYVKDGESVEFDQPLMRLE